MDIIKKHHTSFKNAFAGLIWAFTTQQNFLIHIILSLAALLLGVLLNVSRLEMLILILAIVFGLGAEMINTSIEAMTDLITVKWSRQAKIAKDISAGMMLLIAAGTLILAVAIFLPKILLLLV